MVYGPWRYAARRGIADVFRMRTCRKCGEGSMRSWEGVYVTVYLHRDQHCAGTARVEVG